MRFARPALVSRGNQSFHPALRNTHSVLLVALALCGCTSDSKRPEKLTGNVLYRERMMLPPGATVTVTLEDVSRADAPAVQLAQTVFQPQGGPPFPFSLEYDPARITAGARYAVRARIDNQGQLLFTTTEFVDPFGTDADKGVELLVRAAARPDARQTLSPGTFEGILP
ncbi:MAG TPA: YbaY family lipoprotein, partial [Candidatus Krumholzibacteria bacterium]|nr:YbaY family lipoprotein [Candidatus Krumholzibacteria bacterium]